MVLDELKLKQHTINKLKVIIILVYILIDLMNWNVILYFVYGKIPPIYGVKILLSIISFIFLFRYLKRWQLNYEIKLANSTIITFYIISLSGSIIEIFIYFLLNNNIFLYEIVVALFAATINVSMLSIILSLIFKIYSNRFELKEHIVTFYVPIITKFGFIVYLLFSLIVISFIIYNIQIEEDRLLNSYGNTVLNQILNVSYDINDLNNKIENDIEQYKSLVEIMFSNKNAISREDIQNGFNNLVSQYFNESYSSISLSINSDYMSTGLPYSLFILRDENTKRYLNRTSDSLFIHSFLENDLNNKNIIFDINMQDRNNMHISSYSPLKLFGNNIGYIILESSIDNIRRIINNNILSKWSYIYYKLDSKDIVLSSDNRFISENPFESIFASSQLINDMEDFESKLSTTIFRLFPNVAINGNKSFVIASYIKDFNIVSIYYKDINSIMKDSNISSKILFYVSIYILVFILAFAICILSFKILLSSINRANISTKDLISGSKDLRNRIVSRSNDEIGVLIYNFNIFLSNLDSIISNLKTESLKVFDEIKTIEKIIDENTNRINDQSSSITESVASVNNIINSIQNVTSSTDQQKHAFSSVSIAIEELLQTIYKINDNMERQSSAVEQTSASIEEMISNITSVAKSVNKADSFSKKLLADAHDGGDTVDEVIEAVRGIEESSDQIKEIVNVIQSIAEQTNLLAMNAAIEAAHAGEQGKGFSVVADEIRSLAENTANNTKSITNIINSITRRIEYTVELATNSGVSLENILDMSENTARVVSEINTANSELEIGGKDILETIRHLNNITSGVKESVKEQMNSGDVVDSQITLLDQITREVSETIESNSVGAKEVIHAMTFLNELSVETIKRNEGFYDATKKLNDIFNNFNDLINQFITNSDKIEKNEDDGMSEDQYDANDSFNKKMDMELETLEKEFRGDENSLKKDEDVLQMLKEDFKNPDMFDNND